jgi:hypothetical protein
MTKQLIAAVTVMAPGLTFAASTHSSEAREYHSRSQALHHLQHHPDRNIYGYSREYQGPEDWREYASPQRFDADPTRNWYGPGEYDRRVNGSDASTPGHN